MADTRTEELRTFLAVAKLGSFAGAARELGLSTSGVSKQIAALEERLGIRLLNRTTRRVALTEVGREFRERGDEILLALGELEDDVRGLQATPRGTLRVSAPQDFGRLFLCGVIGRFAVAYPELRIDLELTDRIVDVVEEGFDVVLRLARPLDSSLVVRRLGACKRVLCASPAYLAKHAAPETPAALERHSCIEYAYQAGRSWPFVEDGRRRSVTPSGRLRANAGWAMREMALAGLGIALLPSFLVADDLRSGALATVLDDALDADIDLMAIMPHRKLVTAKVRAFVDLVVETIGRESWFRSHDPRGVPSGRRREGATRR